MQGLAAGYYRKGLIRNWFFEWKNIKHQITGKLSDPEKVELKEMEKEIHKVLNNKLKSVKLIEEYLERIQDLIEDHDIGLVSKGDETVFT